MEEQKQHEHEANKRPFLITASGSDMDLKPANPINESFSSVATEDGEDETLFEIDVTLSFRTGSLDDEDETGDYISNSPLLQDCQRSSSYFGLVLGIFIQLSCMGAFFLYTTQVVAARGVAVPTNKWHAILFTVLWSAGSSIVGLLVMLLLSALVRVSSNATSVHRDNFVTHMELHVAMGAVVGVSLAWTIKNLLSAVAASSLSHDDEQHHYGLFWWQTGFTISVAALYGVAARSFLRYSSKTTTPTEPVNSLTEPLLAHDDEEEGGEEESTVVTTVNKPHFVKAYSLALGLMVGGLIQISSLASHYLLLPTPMATRSIPLHPHMLLVMGTVWDLITSVMGIGMLAWIRHILVLYWSMGSSRPFEDLESVQTVVGCQSKDEEEDSVLLHAEREQLLSCLDSYFAMGALLGVNLAWVLTDCVLGLLNLVGQSCFTLSVSMLWWWFVSPATTGLVRTTPKKDTYSVSKVDGILLV